MMEEIAAATAMEGAVIKPPGLSEQMKRDNWQFYVLSRSNDPSVMIPNTRKLVSNLVASAKVMKNWTHNDDLVFCIKTVNEAWYEYAENKDWGFAVQLCEMVLDKIAHILYDDDWATGQKDSFVSSGGKK